MSFNPDEIYQSFKHSPVQYNEEIHCPLMLKIMNDPDKGTVSAFCVAARIGQTRFYEWVLEHSLFRDCYDFGKMLAREAWEEDGRQLRYNEVPIGTIDHSFEHWRMIGWSRFGVGKNSRIKLNLKASDTPIQHYKQLLQQASDGDFTAGEIKQLMEAINVGLNAHQVFSMQEEIDALKADLTKMNERGA